MARARGEAVSDIREEWAGLLKRHYRKQIGELEREFPHRRSLYLDYRQVERFSPHLADELLATPGKVLEDVRDTLVAVGKVREGERDRINIRFTNLPRRVAIRDIRAEHINRFVSVEGIIRKITEVRPRIVEAVFSCQSCHRLLPPEPQGFGRYQEPDQCPYCERKTKLSLIPSRSRFVDSQKIRIQESPEGLRGGEQPQSLDVDVTDDLTGNVAPGDRVVLNGILRSTQREVRGMKHTLFDIHLECNSIEIAEKEFEEVEIAEQDEEAIRALASDPNLNRKIVNSIAPTIYGNEEVKEAIALQLFGGIAKEMPDSSHLRGDIHMLLVGDPGIAKSQLLRYVVKISPRGIYTSGKSATSAGLTATAVKDEFGDGRWTLEAGALVLADMGIAAVDELDKMQKEDRSALHEAMEQQSISIAKAGITATLKSRCALLGAANPKMGRFDQWAPIGEQINLPPSLLSRFDLIFVMTDQPAQERDEAIAEHILKAHSVGELMVRQERMPTAGITQEQIKKELAPVMPDIEPSLLRKYIAYAKRNSFPILTPDAKRALVEYYLRLRGLADPSKPVPVTARQLEALVRLAEASARMRLSQFIEISDAERVIRIVDACLRQIAYDPKSGIFDIDKIATGITKQTRDLIRTIKEAIRSIGGDSGNRAPIEKVVETVASQGFEKDKVRRQIEELIRHGEAIEPRHGIIQLI
ncbi:MAG: minichromosome maintenance protein MCM [Methanomicrobiales archaeon]|nr:minichromosome maintenance protein MCM [Methanomicrobiales archaeon]